MMKVEIPVSRPLNRWYKTFRLFHFAVLIGWTVVIVLSLAWNIYQHRRSVEENGRVIARTAFEKDLLYRRWNALNGGIYAPVSDITPPNPYLKNYPDWIVHGENGVDYTQINPAYMSRQVFDLQEAEMGVRGHITSLKPLRPENAADDWEVQALKAFEAGSPEESGVQSINQQTYLRLMRPLFVEESCLACHATQEYQLGQVRGGISESVPLTPLFSAAQPYEYSLIGVHILIWLTGLALILVFSHQLSFAILEQTRAEERLVYMSTHDALTGLYNRHYFEKLVAQLDSYLQHPVSALAADLDDLKKVNDSAGHAAGDDLLRQASEALRGCFRAGDTLARIGGDEFMVLLPNTNTEQAELILNRVREQMDEWRSGRIRISLGMATGDDGTSLTEIMRQADQAMYADKQKRKTFPEDVGALAEL
jgi:diguanylate cyclase (GGDEF)-like protein